MKMPFGKYKGHEVHAVPSYYLKWLLAKGELSEPLKSAVEMGIDKIPHSPPIPRDIELEAEYVIGYVNDRGEYLPPWKPAVRRPYSQP